LKLNQTRHSLAWPIQHYGPEIPAEFCNAKCLYLGKCNKVYTSWKGHPLFVLWKLATLQTLC
jgi:hypothetical protein